MSFEQFKALTFDVVGTLIDFERGILEHLRKSVGDAAESVSDEDILAVYRASRERHKCARYPDDLERTYYDIISAFGWPEAPGGARGLIESVKDWPAFPDSVDALKRLRRHFKLVAMTNARHWALDHMARTLEQPFDDKISVDDVRFEKPDPQFFAYARGRLSTQGIVFEEILHVAQSQYHDIGVAKRLGYQVCWIERRHGLPGPGGTQASEYTEPHHHFTTLAQLADAVEAELG
ncbi:HAD-IA family hydrolase [Halotalea alkalilenta]|uniref:2-haloalkanoic acid dehalogenase n=1 Tax=Halotalea alkalilenta TaxID=376489 RepID=A0A172YCD8_9GAMM|nr:HAD-IA family hydrolase [Halotalea alkalilenta]ANF56884.1 2-haloalkanoic acid dehalogenase [Halotalea alkalilenta]